MGVQLANFYTEVGKTHGFTGRMKLAMLTHVPSEKAAAVPDSPENIQLFQRAMRQLDAQGGK